MCHARIIAKPVSKAITSGRRFNPKSTGPRQYPLKSEGVAPSPGKNDRRDDDFHRGGGVLLALFQGGHHTILELHDGLSLFLLGDVGHLAEHLTGKGIADVVVVGYLLILHILPA